MIPEDLIHGASRVLADCKGPNGLRASAQSSANYAAYFTRDTVINSLGLSLAGNKELLPHLEVQLKQLKFLQRPEGQIASNFNAGSIKGPEVSFGTLTPKLDGPSWFIIGVCHLIQEGHITPKEWRSAVMKALAVMDALDYNGDGLIYCPMGSDWADEYICQGYVLHIQVLRVWALMEAASCFGDDQLSAKAEKIRGVIEARFTTNATGANKSRYLFSSFSHSEKVEQFDFASNMLYAYLFPDAALTAGILEFVRMQFLDKGLLVPAFSPEIREANSHWDALRRFHLFEFKNRPGHYHNGGAWWIWQGWYAITLNKHGRDEDIQVLRAIVGRFFNNQGTFDFKEYITPDSQEGGQGQMAFTASGLIMLQKIFTAHA